MSNGTGYHASAAIQDESDSLTVASTEVKSLADFTGLSADALAVANTAHITAKGGVLRVLWSGATPTTTFGHIVADGSTLIVTTEANVSRLKMIAESTNVVVTVTLEA